MTIWEKQNRLILRGLKSTCRTCEDRPAQLLILTPAQQPEQAAAGFKPLPVFPAEQQLHVSLIFDWLQSETPCLHLDLTHMHARTEPGVHSQQWTKWNWVLRERNEPSPCLPPHSGCICYITCCYTKLKDLCVGSSVWDDALNIYSFIYLTSSKQCEPASGQDSDSKKMLWTESSAIGISFSPPWAAVSHTKFSSRFLRSSQHVSTHG